MAQGYPISKTQKMVLDAMGLSARDYAEAARIFENMGIVVTSRREGRSTVPVVTVKNRYDGGFNDGGDGESWQAYKEYDFSAIAQWIK